MNGADLERKLIAVARRNPPPDRVPYAFEKRIMARLRKAVPADPWAFWGQALWRAAAPCIAITLLFSAWTVLVSSSAGPDGDFDQELENTVLASFEPDAVLEQTW
jgi:hypothetical protein